MINTDFTYNGLTLNDQSSNFLSGAKDNIDWTYIVTRVSGLDDPGFRESRENRAAMHGQIDYAHFLAERMVTLEGKIIGKSVSDLVTKRQDLDDAFIKDGQYHWLGYQLSGQDAKQVYCKVFTKEITEIYKEKYIRPFRINLIAVDPRIYSQTEYTKTVYIPSAEGGRTYDKTYSKSYGVVQTGGKIVCLNSGNFPCLPLIKMYGPLTNPRIRNNDDSAKEIQVNIEVAVGDYLEIDFEEKTIMLNGTASRYNYLDTDSEWWKLNSGNNEIEFRDGGGDTDAYAQIIYRYGWI